jgi:uncharacterized heparinase superfamily protein
MAEIGRLLRTVAHLAPGQVWHRLRLTLRRALWERRSGRIDGRYRDRAAALPAARFDHPGLARVAAFRTAGDAEALLQTAREALAGRFTFLNRSVDFGREIDWYRPDLDVGTRLWKTHLHEFSYAPALAFADVRAPSQGHRARLFALIDSWSEASPIGRPGFALDAWNSRAVATRLVHWAVAGCLLGLRGDDSDGRQFGTAIGLHGLFLRDNLELDLCGNHLLRDAVGLVFADALVGGVPDALDWLERQVREQLLPDGCHVEAAPMYHAVCLQDLLEVQLLLGDTAPGWLADAVRRMGGMLESLQLGDGDLPLLGDGWLGEVDVGALLDACRAAVGPLPAPAAPERHSGLVRLQRGALRAVVRAGPHGPDYMLGHAHADLLSFELSLGSRRLVSDTGTAGYDPGPQRRHLRSTAAHNTLQIDAVEQLETWGSFRVGRRGRAQVDARGSDGAWDWVSASCDAFQWLRGRPRHARLLAVSERVVLVLDAVMGRGEHEIASRLHLHPDHPDGETQVLALCAEARRGRAPYHERFGETREMNCLEVAATAELPWVGGWLIVCNEAAGANRSGEIECNVRMNDGIVQLDCSGALSLAATWRPGAGATGAEGPAFLCSPDRESAT